MKFEKIIIPPGWQESFTKYPNGRTIFEALTSTITSVNEGIEAVNTKVDQGLLAIDAAADTIRSDVNTSFLILQNKLEQDFEYLQDDLVADISVLQSQVDAAVDSVADKVTQSQLAAVNAQLAEKALKTTTVNGKALSANISVTAADVPNTPAGGIAATTVQTAINELDTEKAGKAQEAWITPTLLNSWTGTVQYRKDTLGNVHFRGTASGGANDTVMFDLPLSYRGLESHIRSVGIGTANQLGIIRFDVSGTWWGAGKVSFNGVSPTRVDFNGLSYPTI